jgi:hypothetical protein
LLDVGLFLDVVGDGGCVRCWLLVVLRCWLLLIVGGWWWLDWWLVVVVVVQC